MDSSCCLAFLSVPTSSLPRLSLHLAYLSAWSFYPRPSSRSSHPPSYGILHHQRQQSCVLPHLHHQTKNSTTKTKLTQSHSQTHNCTDPTDPDLHTSPRHHPHKPYHTTRSRQEQSFLRSEGHYHNLDIIIISSIHPIHQISLPTTATTKKRSPGAREDRKGGGGGTHNTDPHTPPPQAYTPAPDKPPNKPEPSSRPHHRVPIPRNPGSERRHCRCSSL